MTGNSLSKNLLNDVHMPHILLLFISRRNVSFTKTVYYKKYNNLNVIPRNHSNSITIEITFYLMSLLCFDEREDTFISAARAFNFVGGPRPRGYKT